MARWRLDAGPAGQVPVAPLATAQDRTFDFNLTEPSTCSFTIDGRSTDAAVLEELVTDVHLLRDGVPIFTGRVIATNDTLDDRKHRTQITCTDLRGVMARRLVRTERNWAGYDVAYAAGELLLEAQQAPYTGLGVTVPSFPAAGSTATRRVEVGQSITSELQALQGSTDGGSSVFDWDVSPGWTNRTARLWAPQRGRDLTGPGGLTLQYRQARPGARTAAFGTVQRQFDPSTYANTLTVVGGTRREDRTVTSTDPATGQQVTETIQVEIPTTPVTVVDDAEVALVGSYAAIESYPDIVYQAELQAKAQSRLAELSRVSATYSFPLRAGLWQGPDTLWLGDTARVLVTSGRVQDDLALRVSKLTLALDSTGAERVVAVVGNPPRNRLTELRDLQRQVRNLSTH